MTIDTHAHLDREEYAADRDDVIRRARESGVEYIINIGCDVASSRKSLELTEAYDFIYAAVGTHPHDVKSLDDAAYSQLRELLQHPKAVAMGEIGLDYFKDYAPRAEQRLHFRKQIELARELKKPVIIHCRDAQDDVLAILGDYYPNPDGVTGVFHCFSGDRAMAAQALAMGFYISFAGTVTFDKATELREAAKMVPAERLFTETDCPFLAPMPHRGKRNEPAYVNRTAEKLAELRGVSVADIQRTTAHNFHTLFGVGPETEPGAIAYRIRNALYLNITNRCTNDCVFCTRLTHPVVQGHNLKIEREPAADEIWRAVGDPARFEEVVFCGFGEPTLRLDIVKEVARRIKAAGGRVRLNTNGHGNVINKRNILPELAGLVDAISVSLNADTSEQYDRICRPYPAFHDGIFDEVKKFVAEAKKHIPGVQVTIVTEQAGVDEAKCAEIAEREFGVKYRPRHLNMVG